jgi:hypothetical protein
MLAAATACRKNAITRVVMIKVRPATEGLEVGKLAKICLKDHQAFSIKKRGGCRNDGS